MEMFSLQARLLTGLGLLAVAALAGAVVNGWRLDARYAQRLTQMKDQNVALQRSLDLQNAVVAQWKLQADAAQARGELARQYADRVVAGLGHRTTTVMNSTAPDCQGVLEEAWKTWQQSGS